MQKKKMKQPKIKNKKQKKKMFSIRSKVTSLVMLSIILSIVLIMAQTIPMSQKALDTSIQNNMLDLSQSYSQLVDRASLQQSGELNTFTLMSLLTRVKVKGVKSSYAYLVDGNGTIRFHPNSELFHMPIEAEEVRKVVTDKTAEPDVPQILQYTHEGVKYYASYTTSSTTGWTLILEASEKEILEPITNIQRTAIITAIITSLILALLAFIISGFITKPIKKLTKLILKVSDLDFTEDKEQAKLNKLKDETGAMSQAINQMRLSLQSIIENINTVSLALNSNALSLETISNTVNNHSTDNSATLEELSASMEETSATTEAIDANITEIEASTYDINNKTTEGRTLSLEIKERAKSLKSNTELARDKTNEIYKQVKIQSTEAIEQSKSVDKINVLTSTIMNIAEQTTLLALNASIEAARAGESGRGFAVVANEIGNLASQSSQTVSEITNIVSEVNLATKNMAQCLEESLEFLEVNVSKDYDTFIEVSSQYSDDAVEFEATMGNISEALNELTTVTASITEAISGINKTVGESARGVSDIAEKTSSIVELTSDTYDMVQDNMANSNNLKEIVDKFTI